MHVELVPALVDNYTYLILNAARTEAIAVDPSETEPVLRALQRCGARLTQIWCTHHHPDHVGGVAGLRATFGDVPVLGSVYDKDHQRIPMQTRAVAHNESFEVWGETVRVLDVPGHTLGAIAYVTNEAVFAGDTLFLAGCGRVFEGTMEMMQRSLDLFLTLSPSLLVYPGHEYTAKNLEFALTVEPSSSVLLERMAHVTAVRQDGRPSVPASLSEETATNPFLRVRESTVIAKAMEWGASTANPSDVFAALRRAKDVFR